MIAHSAPATSTRPSGAVEASSSDGALTAAELYQLTLYKWRYSFEALGFDDEQVRELMFLKWLHATGRVAP